MSSLELPAERDPREIRIPASGDELVERVAKRIYDYLAPDTAFDYCHNISQTRWGDAARAVIAIVKADR